MRLLITGAAGYVGRELLTHVSPHYDLLLLDKSTDVLASESCDAEKMHCDLNSLSMSDIEILENFSGIVVHLAAARSDQMEAREYYSDNILATEALLDALEPSSIKGFIHFGSVAVFDGEMLRQDDISTSDDHYRYTKYEQQRKVEKWCTVNAVSLSIITPSAIYDEKYGGDTNVARLVTFANRFRVMPSINTKKSLSNMTSLLQCTIEAINEIIHANPNPTISRFIVIDDPVLTVDQIVQQHCKKKVIFLPVPFIKKYLLLFSRLLKVFSSNYLSELTEDRIKKLFKSTDYRDIQGYTFWKSRREGQ